MTLGNQQGDVLLYMEENSGNMQVENGVTTMDVGYKTMLVLSLAGGNEFDDGSESTVNLQWWGNEGEPAESQLRSYFNGVVWGLPFNSSNLRVFEDAARKDIERDFVATGFATELELSVSLVNPKRLLLEGLLTMANGVSLPFSFDVNKDAEVTITPSPTGPIQDVIVGPELQDVISGTELQDII
jgi:hypothetical protein